MARKNKHHYLPRMYLSAFCDNDNMIWMYKKDDPGNPVSSKPDNMACENGLYHLDSTATGEDIDFVENLFANVYEGPTVKALKSLREKQFPTVEEKEQLSLFFGMLMVRSPAYLKHFNSMFSEELSLLLHSSATSKDNFYDSYKKANPELSDDEIERDRQEILSGNFEPTIKKNVLLHCMLRLGKNYAVFFESMHWALIETDVDYPFITSDMILNIYNPNISPSSYYGPGLGHYGSTVFLPISNHLSLMMVNSSDFIDGQIFSINAARYTSTGDRVNVKEIVKIINRIIFLHSYKYIFASSNSDKLKRLFQNLSKKSLRGKD
jgi:hypothetical protein